MGAPAHTPIRKEESMSLTLTDTDDWEWLPNPELGLTEENEIGDLKQIFIVQ